MLILIYAVYHREITQEAAVSAAAGLERDPDSDPDGNLHSGVNI